MCATVTFCKQRSTSAVVASHDSSHEARCFRGTALSDFFCVVWNNHGKAEHISREAFDKLYFFVDVQQQRQLVAAPLTQSSARLTLIQKLKWSCAGLCLCALTLPRRSDMAAVVSRSRHHLRLGSRHGWKRRLQHETQTMLLHCLLWEPFFRRTVGCMPCHLLGRSSWWQDGILPLPQFRCPVQDRAASNFATDTNAKRRW